MNESTVKLSKVPLKKPTVNELKDFLFGWNTRDRIFYGLADNGDGSFTVVPIGGAVLGNPTYAGTFKGTCNLLTNPGTPVADEWWSATEVGTYTNFGGVVVETMDQVFNYIKWDNATSTWSVERVEINMANTQIPRVADGPWDLSVNSNLEIEVNPYASKKAINPGFAYFYKYYSGLVLPDSGTFLYLDGGLWATYLKSTASMQVDNGNTATGWSVVSKTAFTNVFTYATIAREINFGIISNYGNIHSRENSSQKSVPTLIGTKNVSAGIANGEYVQVDDLNQRFTINMTKILLNKGTASKLLITDANKEIAYRNLPPLTLADFYTDAGNVAPSPTDLHSYTMPANTLTENGQKLKIDFSGNSAVNANEKTIVIYIGATTMGSGIYTDAGISWRWEITAIRTSSSILRITGRFSKTGYTPSDFYYELTGYDFTAAITIKVVGDGDADNDVVARMGSIELIQKA